MSAPLIDLGADARAQAGGVEAGVEVGVEVLVRSSGLAISLEGRALITDLRLWIEEGEERDQLITLTEGVIVEEERGPRHYLEGAASRERHGAIELSGTAGERELTATVTVAPRTVTIEASSSGAPLRLGAGWRLPCDVRVTGAGARHGMRFDQTGRTIQLGADRRYTGPDCPPDLLEAGGIPQGDYTPVPWLLSSAGWAAWIDCDGPGVELDLAAEVAVSVRAASGSLRLHLLLDRSPAALLRHYCELTGFGDVLPEWGYGHWKSRDVYEHERDVIEDFDGYAEHRLPLDAIVLDSPWETQYNSWRFNPWQFPDPEQLIARMRQRGVRTVVWTTPWVNVESTDGQRPPDAESERSHAEPAENYAEGEQRGHYVRGADGQAHVGRWWMGTGSPIDFSSAAAREWWIEQARGVLRLGVEGIKADDGEGYYFPPEAQFADGRSGAEAAWAYPGLYREAMQEALDAEHPGSGVLFARSGWSGAQGPGHVWGGDQASDFWSLEALVAATLTAAASGISNWSHDVGGYLGKRLLERCPAELFVRWAQFGCFTPLMQAHARQRQEAWTYRPETLELFRDYAILHERLVPYIRAAAATAARSGLPIVRPLCLVDPGDEQGWEIADAYMFGPAFWVAPVLEEGAERRLVHLPGGEWIDFWTGARTLGGREVIAPSPLERIPVWVRPGSIVLTYPAETVAAGLGEEDPSRPLEATLWGEPPLGRATARTVDGTTVRRRAGEWSVEGPEREVRFRTVGVNGNGGTANG